VKLESEILLAQNAVEPVQNDSENHRDGENQSSAATETSEGSSANAESEDPNLVDNNEASSQDNEGPAEDLKQIDAQWNCEARASDVEPIVSLDNLYVGDTYLLHCEGDFVEGFATAEATLDFVVQEQSYTLKILKMRTFEAGEFWAEVTSYKPGEHKFDGVVITDSLQNIALSSEQPVVIKSALAERPQMEAMNPGCSKNQIAWSVSTGIAGLGLDCGFWCASGFGFVGLALCSAANAKEALARGVGQAQHGPQSIQSVSQRDQVSHPQPHRPNGEGQHTHTVCA
jgi:hypothetical protein